MVRGSEPIFLKRGHTYGQQTHETLPNITSQGKVNRNYNEISPHLWEWLPTKNPQITSVSEKGTLSYTVGRIVNWSNYCEEHYDNSSKKTKKSCHMAQEIPLLGIYLRKQKHELKKIYAVLTCVAQLVGCHPAKWKVPALIPCQGTCLGCGFGPWLGHVHEAIYRCFSLTLMFLSLSFSLPSPLSRKKINKII